MTRRPDEPSKPRPRNKRNPKAGREPAARARRALAYEVTLRRDVQQVARVLVEACSPSKAIAVAESFADDATWRIEEQLGTHRSEARRAPDRPAGPSPTSPPTSAPAWPLPSLQASAPPADPVDPTAQASDSLKASLIFGAGIGAFLGVLLRPVERPVSRPGSYAYPRASQDGRARVAPRGPDEWYHAGSTDEDVLGITRV